MLNVGTPTKIQLLVLTKGFGYRLTNLTSDRSNLLNDTSSLKVSHCFHGLSGHINQAKEVDLHLLPNLLF
jgi:hypothetical protein